MAIATKRVYDPPARSDGCRVLVDRIWPRGVRKADAHIDYWLKDIAPSVPLRKWFAHDPAKWAEFQRRYRKELNAYPEMLAMLRGLARKGKITLLFAAKDTHNNNAVALAGYLRRR